MYKIYVLSARQ